MAIVCLGHPLKPFAVWKITIFTYVAEFEMDNENLFRPIREAVNRTKFNTHAQNIKKQYTWGTSTEITAAATLLQMEVYVATDSYRPGIPIWLQYTKPASLLANATNLTYLSKHNINIQRNIQWIELTHISSIHFDTTKPLKGCCTLSKPKLEGVGNNQHFKCSIHIDSS